MSTAVSRRFSLHKRRPRMYSTSTSGLSENISVKMQGQPTVSRFVVGYREEEKKLEKKNFCFSIIFGFVVSATVLPVTNVRKTGDLAAG